MRKLNLLILISLMNASCMTIIGGYKRPYGGVMSDVNLIASKGKLSSEMRGSLVVQILAVVDIPLTLVADTLLLPLTIPMAIYRYITRNSEDEDRQMLLMAVRKGNISAAAELLESGVSPDTYDPDPKGSKEEVVITAYKAGDMEMCALLVNNGASLERKFFTEKMDINRVESFIREMGNRLDEEQIKETEHELMKLAIKKNSSRSVNFLMQKGIYPHPSNLESAVIKNSPAMLEMILKAGVDPNQRGPLRSASRMGRPGMTAMLLKYMALKTPKPCRNNGLCAEALYESARNSSSKNAELILAAGAEIDDINIYWKRRTALMGACESHNAVMARYFLAKGADPFSQDFDGYDCLAHAVDRCCIASRKKEYQEIFSLLFKKIKYSKDDLNRMLKILSREDQEDAGEVWDIFIKAGADKNILQQN